MQVQLEREKETKNKVRFQEVGGEDLIGILYVPKTSLRQLGDPDRITLTVAAAGAEAPPLSSVR